MLYYKHIHTQNTYRKLLDSPVSISNTTINSFGHKTIVSSSTAVGFSFYEKTLNEFIVNIVKT